MKTNLNKQEQSGRSMVEMLGVLAVIGVLSVAGIAGYTTAMNKYQANKILNGAYQRAMYISTQIQVGGTPSLAEFTDNSVGGATFDTTVLKADGNNWATGQTQFALSISSVGKDICEQIYNTAGTSGSVRTIYSGTDKLTASSGCKDLTTMRFVYNNDLTTTDSSSDSENETNPCPTGMGTNTTLYKGNQNFTYTTQDEVVCYCENEGEFYSSGKNGCIAYKVVLGNKNYASASELCTDGFSWATYTDFKRDFISIGSNNYSQDLRAKTNWDGTNNVWIGGTSGNAGYTLTSSGAIGTRGADWGGNALCSK